MILLFHGLQPSTNVTKNSILGVLGVFDPPMGFYNVVLKFVQVFKLCNFAYCCTNSFGDNISIIVSHM